MRPGAKMLFFGLAGLISSPAFPNDSEHPTVVELYQSQGCSSCPPAIANVNAISGRPDILALIFSVTYWDQLGWKDTFARPEFTRRQWEFARAAGRSGVATPQTIVNGRIVTNGGDAAGLAAAIRAGDRGTSGPTIRELGGKVLVRGAPPKRPATIWLVRYDPRLLRVPIRAGENGGRTIAHRNVVHSLSAIGVWRGPEAVVPVQQTHDPNLRSAILVQSGSGGPIIAAANLRDSG